MQLWQMIAIPLIGGFIGYLTNYIAIKMIFHPKKKIKLGFIEIQGLLPKRREQLAYSIAQTVDKNLINSQQIAEIISNLDLKGEFDALIEAKIEEFLHQKLFSQFPMLAMFFSGDIKDKVKETLKDEIVMMLPTLSQIVSQKVEDTIDVHQIIFEKIQNFPLEKLEEIVYDIAKTEMKAIEIFGGVLGIIIGIIQVIIIQLF